MHFYCHMAPHYWVEKVKCLLGVAWHVVGYQMWFYDYIHYDYNHKVCNHMTFMTIPCMIRGNYDVDVWNM